MVDEDAVSLLPSHTSYQAYRPPHDSETSNSVGTIPILNISSRLPTPPIYQPITWPGIVPSRHQSPAPSLGFRPKLFGNHNTEPYEENLAWANSTHFRANSESSMKPEFADMLEGTRPSKQYFRNPRHIREPWRAGSMKRFPWRGVGSLFLVLLLTGSSITIVIASRTTAPSLWNPIQPPVYLSILELFMGLFTLYALSEGVAIAFWLKLLHGATIAEVYEAASLGAAVRRLLRLQWSRVGVASIFAALSLARGPLMQRALVLADGVYAMNVVFVALGMIISLTSIFAILPLYNNYGTLGRSVSLNALEIARAFGAPLFDGLDGNMTTRDIEIEKGDLAVRYGAVERNGEEKVLRIEDTSKVNVRMPREGEIFG